MASDILIVDDEVDIRELISGLLSDEGYETRIAGNSTQALEAVRQRRPSLVILDIWLQGSELDGMKLLEIIKSEHDDLPVVMISGHGNIETAVSATKIGAYDFIEKPFKADHLIAVISRALETASLRQEVSKLRLRMGEDIDLIGESAAINLLRQTLDKVAPTGSRVMITGPAGVGKEVVARSIHKMSERKAGPFVVVNCATMRPERLEIELFGVEMGGDGPASLGKTGTFEQSHGGTLFLDEVGDMPLETQGKIVRALQDHTFFRVGGDKPVFVDVRVISSSNRDLTEEMAAGRFREDLFFRLNVVPIKIPSAKERREDIPTMIKYFIKNSAEISGMTPRKIGDDAMAILQNYDWPGNIRQLKNVVDWLLIMAPGGPDDKIRANMLPPEITGRTPVSLQMNTGEDIMSLPLRGAREAFECEYLMAQITRFGGNISRTASFVGMERSALHRKLKSLGVQYGGKISAAGDMVEDNKGNPENTAGEGQ
jgi:two-component system nitrogen regulation response regulator NtrX